MLDTILEFSDGPVKYEKSGRGHIKKVFGKEIEIKIPYPRGENMGVITNL